MPQVEQQHALRVALLDAPQKIRNMRIENRDGHVVSCKMEHDLVDIPAEGEPQAKMGARTSA